MNSWKKTNEVWFGDTFDRSSVTACNAELAYDSAISSDITGYAITKGVNSYDTICIDKVDTLSDKLISLQAQIDDLKKKLETKKENSELRSALKTLHYKREVE